METLHSRFTQTLKDIGLEALPCAVFYLAKAGLRFQIGGDGGPYLADHRKPSGAYLQEALDRALAIYAALPQPPDLLRIDRDREDAQALPLSVLRKLGLPEPEETVGTDSREYFYWTLPKAPDFLRSLLREIIRGELDAAGLDALVSNVYFLSTNQKFLYHLYDDRGADVVAAEKELLLPLYGKLGSWLLESGRSRMDALFSGSTAP